jgi:hypothetical protein
VIHHGSLTRYLLIALERLGYSVISTAWRFNAVDDFLCSFVPPLRRIGGVALLWPRLLSLGFASARTAAAAAPCPRPASSASPEGRQPCAERRR